LIAGFINYSNSYPFYAALQASELVGLQMETHIPAELNRKLHAGELAMSAISLFEYLQHEQDYWLLPNWCINSRGHVRSVLLFSKIPFSELNKKNILLCSESATSNNLLKLLLNHHKLEALNFKIKESRDDLNDWDAILLIGDPALNFKHTDFVHVTDLAEAWVHWTQGPVVFAIQAVRKDQCTGNTDLIKAILEVFAQVQVRLKHDLEKVCDEVQQAFPEMNTDFLDYFRCLDFQLDENCLKAIRRYAHESQLLGTLTHSPKLQFAPL